MLAFQVDGCILAAFSSPVAKLLPNLGAGTGASSALIASRLAQGDRCMYLIVVLRLAAREWSYRRSLGSRLPFRSFYRDPRF